MKKKKEKLVEEDFKNQKYEIIKEISCGSYGRVSKIKSLLTNKFYA